MRFFGKSGKTVTMKSIPPILTVFLALANLLVLPPARGLSSPPDRPSAASTQERLDANRLLENAVGQLENRHSIAAELGCRIDIFNQKLTGRGIYREVRVGPIPYIRTELTFPMDPKPGVIVQVCDSRYLWTYRNLAKLESLERIDLVQADKVLEEGRAEESAKNPGEKASARKAQFDPRNLANPTGLLGAGGLSRLLREIQGAFLCQMAGPGTLSGTPVWIVKGKWRLEKLAELLGKSPGAVRKMSPEKLEQTLPDHLPDSVVVLLGQQDLFPYRIEYRRNGNLAPTSEISSTDTKTLVAIQLTQVKLDAPINFSCFEYQPGDLEIKDETDTYIDALQKKQKVSSKTSGTP